MGLDSLAGLASALSTQRLQQDVGLTVLKKALDMQTASAAALLSALPPTAASLPAHLGQTINTTA